MARINLLPWREELRKQRQNDFVALIAAGVLVTVVLGVVVYLGYSQLVTGQNARNGYLKEQIKILDNRIEEIKTLEAEREQLISRMRAIEELQTSRPLNVRMFDELAARNPEGVSVNKLSQAGTGLSLEGVSQSNARVSSLMRSLDSSQWLTEPRLRVIEIKEEDNTRRSYYTVGVKQTVPKPEGEEKGK